MIAKMPNIIPNPPKEPKNFGNRDEIVLGVLAAIDRDSATSQRTISRELGVALGLANAYLKRCVKKGFIKVQQVPRRRYIYYLTPQGFAEKTRLTGEYLSASFTFFRRAREQMSELLAQCTGQGWSRVAFAGVSDLAEIGVLCARDQQVTIVAIIDPARAGEQFLGFPVVASLEDCGGPVDVIVVTGLTAPETIARAAEGEIGPSRVLAPALLRIKPSRRVPLENSEQAAE